MWLAWHTSEPPLLPDLLEYSYLLAYIWHLAISEGIPPDQKQMPLVWWPSGLMCWYQFLGHLWCDTDYPWAHISSGSYHRCFMSSFHLYISFHLTLWMACVPFENTSTYNMYLFNLWIPNHTLIKIKISYINKWNISIMGNYNPLKRFYMLKIRLIVVLRLISYPFKISASLDKSFGTGMLKELFCEMCIWTFSGYPRISAILS